MEQYCVAWQFLISFLSWWADDTMWGHLYHQSVSVNGLGRSALLHWKTLLTAVMSPHAFMIINREMKIKVLIHNDLLSKYEFTCATKMQNINKNQSLLIFGVTWQSVHQPANQEREVHTATGIFPISIIERDARRPEENHRISREGCASGAAVLVKNVCEKNV